jgi:hypothetical protein
MRRTASPKSRVTPAAIVNWLLLPWHAAQLFTGRKSFAGNPILGGEWLNRRGLHIWRVRLAQRLATRRRARLQHLISETDRAAFARSGFVEAAGFLAPDAFEALSRRLQSLVTEAREMREGNAITRRIPVTPALLREVPELRPLLESPRWRGLTRYVASFDAEPVTYIQTIFAKAGGAVEDPQTQLHMDTFHPTMKAWFFLHDVTDAAGPLTYVEGSHRQSPRRLAWQRGRSVAASQGPAKGGAFRMPVGTLPRLGWDAPRHFAVSANTLVVADTSGFHARAASDQPSLRVEIYAFSRTNPFYPFLRPILGWFPALGRRRVPLQYWLQDRLSPLGLAPMTWRRAGAVSPAAPAPQEAAGPEAAGGAALPNRASRPTATVSPDIVQ